MKNKLPKAVKPVVDPKQLADIASRCLPEVRLIQDWYCGDDWKADKKGFANDGTANVNLVDKAVTFALDLILRAHKIAHFHNLEVLQEKASDTGNSHYRTEPGGAVVPVGVGASENETLDEDMDEIPERPGPVMMTRPETLAFGSD